MDEVLERNSQSDAPMQLGSVYTFDQGQFAAYPSSGSDYVIYNAMAGEYGFGLAQQATVNDAQVFTPICVEPVLTDEAAYFTPTDQISIFLSSASNSGTLIPRAKIALYPQPNPGARWVVGIGYSVAAVQAMQAFAQNVDNNAIYAHQNLGIWSPRFDDGVPDARWAKCSSRIVDIGSHFRKHIAKHVRRQHAGIRVVARAVIAGKQRDLANAFVPKHVAARMLEHRL
jgi:hypothetical protein